MRRRTLALINVGYCVKKTLKRTLLTKSLLEPLSEVYAAGVHFQPLTSPHEIYLVSERASGDPVLPA